MVVVAHIESSELASVADPTTAALELASVAEIDQIEVGYRSCTDDMDSAPDHSKKWEIGSTAAWTWRWKIPN